MSTSVHFSPPAEIDPSVWSRTRRPAIDIRRRYEKPAAREPDRKGVSSFLFLRKMLRHLFCRQKTVEELISRNLVFVHASLKDRWKILNTGGTACFVEQSAARPAEISEKEIITIRRFLEQGAVVDSCTSRVRLRSQSGV